MSDNLEQLKQLYRELQLERERLAANQQVPLDELRRLVFVTYACTYISVGRASELLNISICEFLDLWQEWILLPENLRLCDHHNSAPYW